MDPDLDPDPQRQCHKLFTGVNDTSDKLFTGVNDTADKNFRWG
jgi:hypothetical protein